MGVDEWNLQVIDDVDAILGSCSITIVILNLLVVYNTYNAVQ